MGERRNELTLLDIFQAYQRRYDIEHFFRFGKQRLLLDRYQTPETGHEEKWWLMAHLAYLHRHPNSATALGNYSACRLTATPLCHACPTRFRESYSAVRDTCHCSQTSG
jgi:hypothetical protein